MKKYKVVGVGHSCLDKICSVENYPREDDSTHITSIFTQGGGAVATALVALSRLGVSASFIGNGGFDGVTDEIERLFTTEGVDTSHLYRRSDSHGLESFVMVNPRNGSRTKFPQRDTNPSIEWNDKNEKDPTLGRDQLEQRIFRRFDSEKTWGYSLFGRMLHARGQRQEQNPCLSC